MTKTIRGTVIGVGDGVVEIAADDRVEFVVSVSPYQEREAAEFLYERDAVTITIALPER